MNINDLLSRPFPAINLVVLAVLQFLASGFARLTGHGQNIEALAGRGGIRPPEVPAGYAFSIWFVIFTLALVFAIYYARTGKNDPLAQALSWPAAILFACSSAWMVAAQTLGDGWHLVFLIVVMWAASVRGLLLAVHSPARTDRPYRLVIRPLFGLYTGWLTAAMFLNITGTFAKDVGTFGLSANAFALFTLVPATVLALVLIRRTRGDLWTGGAMLWALSAIMVETYGRLPETALVFYGATAALITLAAALFFAQRCCRIQT